MTARLAERPMGATPRTDAIMELIGLSNHEECDFDHHRMFVAQAHTAVRQLERENAALVAALEEINRDAWSDDPTRLRAIARCSDAALALARQA